MQLKRDALPRLDAAGVKLFVVGIGSAASAREFCDALEFPVERLLVDESDLSDAYRAAGTRNTQRDGENEKQIFEGVGSMWSGATNDAIRTRGKGARGGCFVGKVATASIVVALV